jgi:hypothetical protein
MFGFPGYQLLSTRFGLINIFTFEHPWRQSQIDGCSTEDLIAVHQEIAHALTTTGSFPDFDKRTTAARIERVLLTRGMTNVGGSFITRVSSINLTALTRPQAVIVMTDAPQRPTREPSPERPAQLHIYDDYGTLMEIRDETEKEKKDREYEIWRQRQG